jgi:hypothetical protein
LLNIYQIVVFTQPEQITKLRQAGLLWESTERDCLYNGWRKTGISRGIRPARLTARLIRQLMRHDRWKRVRGVIKQIHPGGIFR